MLGLPEPSSYGPFMVLELANGASLDFIQDDGEIQGQHYAFLVGEDDFDAIWGRLRETGRKWWADPYVNGRARSTTRTVDGASTGRARTGTGWRSSPAPTAVEPE